MTHVAVPLASGIVGLIFVGILVREVLSRDPGNEVMQRISLAIQEGARAFLKREYLYVSVLVVAVTSE
jgi:K(+)-stimulated pyrophosphate-energized sodium pump